MKKSTYVIIFFFILFAASISVNAQNKWQKDNFKIELTKSDIVIYNLNKKLVDISSINFNFTPPKSVRMEKGGRDTLILKLNYSETAEYNSNENTELTAELKITTAPNEIHLYSSPGWAKNTTIQMRDLNDHFFGILERLYPNNFKSPDLRGNVVDVKVKGEGNQYHENYSSVWSAFYMTNRGYASFFDTFAEGKYKLGINGITELYHHTGKLDWYLFTGKNGDGILNAYYKVIGRPKFVPLWACGPVAWRDQNNGGKDEIISDINRMTELKIPFTAWFVDRPYSNGSEEWSKMDFNSKFNNPQNWIKTINDKYGLQFMTWVGPMTFSDKDFTGLLTNFKGYIDLTNPDAVKQFGDRLKKNQYEFNIRGHKMDRADEQFPETAGWYDGTPEQERMNKYVYLYAKVIDKFLTGSFGEDQFNFARAGFQRCQPYLSAVWGGDSRSTWDGMSGSIANSMRCGFMGFPVWGSDVGGYLGGRIPETLYARWLEFGSWSGLFEIKLDNAGGKGEDRPPWNYSKKLQQVFREACNRRMKLLPYIYSYSNTSYENGVLMKPLAYQYPEDKNTFEIWNEYLFGGAFLIAPVTDTTNSRMVYLPEGNWLNYYKTTEVYKGGRTINVKMPEDQIPVFIRQNSIYLSGNLIPGNSKNWINKFGEAINLTIHVFPGHSGEKTWFEYVDCFDGNKHKNISFENNSGKYRLRIDPVSIACKVELLTAKEPKRVTINGKIVRTEWDNINRICILDLSSVKAYDVQFIY